MNRTLRFLVVWSVVVLLIHIAHAQQQSLCSSLLADTQPSWCKYNNPFLLPLLTDTSGASTTQLPTVCDENCIVPNVTTTNLNCYCKSFVFETFFLLNMVNSCCSDIIRVVPVEDAYTQTYYPYTVIGLISGRMIVKLFNDAGSVSPYTIFSNQNLLNIDAIVWNHSLDIFAIGASTQEIRRITCYTGGQFCAPYRNKVIDTIPVEQYLVKSFQSIIHERSRVLVTLLQYKNSTTNFELRFYTISDSATPIAATWKITTIFPPYSSSINLELFITTQAYKYQENTILTSNEPRRTLIGLFNSKLVKLFHLPSNVSVSDQTQIFILDPTHDTPYAQSTVFSVRNELEEITAADAFAETLKRFDMVTSTCNHFDALSNTEPLGIAVATNQMSIYYRNAPDFGAIDSNQTISVTNPAQRPDNFNCINGYWDNQKSKCFYPIIFNVGTVRKRITKLQHRFLKLPRDVTLESKDKAAICDFFPSSYKDTCIHDMTVLCNVQLYQKYYVGILRNAWYHQVFALDEENTLSIYGVQNEVSSTFNYLISGLSIIPFVGKVLDLTVATNGFHLFAAISRNKWELESLQRYGDICAQLKANTSDPFLQPYESMCRQEDEVPDSYDLDQYAMHSTRCFPSMYCPYFTSSYFDQAKNGFYTFRPNLLLECEKGNYCKGGVKSACPKGFYCPNDGMSLPTPCTDYLNGNQNGLELTCYEEGLVLPKPCPKGAKCIGVYFPPLPAPPGYVLTTNTSTLGIVKSFTPCQNGEWCSLGRELYYGEDRDTLLCPSSTSCPQTNILEPIVCQCNGTYCSYCPTGTYSEQPCPAGSFCDKPDHITNCTLSDYCAPGSFQPKPCQKGHYCPSPSEEYLCPSGTYCKTGSVYAKPCIPLSFCPAGSFTETNNAFSVLTLVFIAVFIILVYFLVIFVRNQVDKTIRNYVKRREERKKQSILEDSGEAALLDTKPILPAEEFFLDIAFQDLGLVLKNGQRVLQQVNGEIFHGQLTAIVGPSGSGKSTFVTTLADKAYYGNRLGKVFVNGVEGSLKNYSSMINFVPQEDIMLRTMTVEETLYFAARTRLGFKKSMFEVTKIVNKVISDLGLEDVRHSVVGDEENRGISGGQRKRVNIGMELVTNPKILLLDEPTSGLDSSSSFEVCQLLRNIAVENNITVICVLHQPRYEIFQLFHRVLILGKGGRTVYLGESERCLDYFEQAGFPCPPRVNPPDFFLDVTTGRVKSEKDENFKYEDLFEMWKEYETLNLKFQTIMPQQKSQITVSNIFKSKSIYEQEVVEVSINTAQEESNGNEIDQEDFVIIEKQVNPLHEQYRKMKLSKEKSLRGTSFLIQLYMCMKRSLIQQVRNLQGLFIEFLLLYVAGLFLGILYRNAEYVGPLPSYISSMCPGVLKELCALPLDDPIITQSFLSTLAVSLAGVMSSLSAFGNEKVVHEREASSGLRSLAYYTGKNIVHLMNIAIGPIVFLSIFYTLFGPRAPVITYYGMIASIYFTAFGFGYLISLIFHPTNAKLAGVVITLVMGMFSGAKPTLKKLNDMAIPIRYFPQLTFLRFGQEALYLVEIVTYKHIYDLDTSLDELGYAESDLLMCILVTLAYGLLFRILGFIVLKSSKVNSWVMRMVRFIGYTFQKFSIVFEKKVTGRIRKAILDVLFNKLRRKSSENLDEQTITN